MSNEEYRRADRYDVPDTVQVVDTMTDAVVGRLGNISETGMLLIGHAPLVDDALYQFRLEVDGDRGHVIEVGAHLLWQDRASAAQTWMGFRFIKVLDDHARPLQHWLQSLASRAG
jgi:hypothetical protein